MKKNIITLLLYYTFLTCCSIMVVKDAAAEYIDTMELGLSSGYRVDQLDWNIAGSSVNVLSELDWKEIEVWQLGASSKLSVGNDRGPYRTFIRGAIVYGWIQDGSVRDSDYKGNNRTEEYSRSLSATEDDMMFDVSIGLGFGKKIWQDRLTVSVIGGYSYYEQNLRITDGIQILHEDSNLLGPIAGLNSTYEAKWYGPFAGIDLELRYMTSISFTGSVEYHWPDYEAEADWNKIDTYAHPVSFRHETEKAEGLIFTLKGSYLFKNNWALDIVFAYSNFKANDGNVITFWNDGSNSPSKFNGVNWQSSSITAGFSHSFK